jgi:hypothetical protein
MADGEPQLVQAPEDLCERRGDVPVHDELSGVRPPVEAPVRHRQQSKVGQGHRTPWLPVTPLDARAKGSGQGLGRRVETLDSDERERDSEEAEHGVAT